MTARGWPVSRLFGASFLILATLFSSPQLALAQFTQQGPSLVGTGAVGAAGQGNSVALSADGNTAIVGGLGNVGRDMGSFFEAASALHIRYRYL
jgi:hypothetical protein